MSNIEQTTPSLCRGWKLRTHGACSETRVLSRACLAKHVRLQLMLGGKVTLAGAVKVRRRVSRYWCSAWRRRKLKLDRQFPNLIRLARPQKLGQA